MYSQSKRMCREQEDHSFFSSQQSKFSSYQLQSLWVLHIANSLQQCSYVEQNRKACWFWLVKNEMLDLWRLLSYSCCYFSLWIFVARLLTWLDRRNSITQALATCEPHITTSCAGLWPPLLLNCSENKRRQRVQSRVCFVCSHGGLPLDAFIISFSDATVPRGGDVTARSMSNMKEGEAAAKKLWGETNLTRNVLRWEAGKAPCGTFAYTPAHQACALSANCGPRGPGTQIVNHMLLFMSLSLFVSSLSLSGTQSNGQSAPWTKGALVSSARRLLLGAAVEMSNRDEMREVLRVGWNCWHLISFHSQF